jgi:hypothetical protein
MAPIADNLARATLKASTILIGGMRIPFFSATL